jgi:hypothetical protein
LKIKKCRNLSHTLAEDKQRFINVSISIPFYATSQPIYSNFLKTYLFINTLFQCINGYFK